MGDLKEVDKRENTLSYLELSEFKNLYALSIKWMTLQMTNDGTNQDSNTLFHVPNRFSRLVDIKQKTLIIYQSLGLKESTSMNVFLLKHAIGGVDLVCLKLLTISL